MEAMVPQRDKEAPKTPEGLPVSLPVAILETQNNMEYRGIMDSMEELKKAITHQCQIPCQH